MNNKKDGIKIYEFCFFGAVLVILILISISIFKNNKVDAYSKNDGMSLEEHCSKAICNDDNTMCYTYALDDGTDITWKGDCSKLTK